MVRHMNTAAQQIPPKQHDALVLGTFGIIKGQIHPQKSPWGRAAAAVADGRRLQGSPEPAHSDGEQQGGMCAELFLASACPTWMVTMRGSGCRVFAPPSMAIPRVGALLDTRIRHEVGSRSPGCGQTAGLPREPGHPLPAVLPRLAQGPMLTPGSHPKTWAGQEGRGEEHSSPLTPCHSPFALFQAAR